MLTSRLCPLPLHFLRQSLSRFCPAWLIGDSCHFIVTIVSPSLTLIFMSRWTSSPHPQSCCHGCRHIFKCSWLSTQSCLSRFALSYQAYYLVKYLSHLLFLRHSVSFSAPYVLIHFSLYFVADYELDLFATSERDFAKFGCLPSRCCSSL